MHSLLISSNLSLLYVCQINLSHFCFPSHGRGFSNFSDALLQYTQCTGMRKIQKCLLDKPSQVPFSVIIFDTLYSYTFLLMLFPAYGQYLISCAWDNICYILLYSCLLFSFYAVCVIVRTCNKAALYILKWSIDKTNYVKKTRYGTVCITCSIFVNTCVDMAMH